MSLVTDKQKEKLIKNNLLNSHNTKDLKPVIKLYNPVGSEIWFITELDCEGFYHGLFHSIHESKLCKMNEKEISSFCQHPDYKIERMGFHPFYTISEYYKRAKLGEHIV